METIFSLKSILPPDCFMASLDPEGCLSTRPHPRGLSKIFEDSNPVGKAGPTFSVQDPTIGLSSSPSIFTKIMAEALTPLRLKGISVIPYLDDLLFFAPSEPQLQGDLRAAISFLKKLGWLINKKVKLNPDTSLTVPGFLGELRDAKDLSQRRR